MMSYIKKCSNSDGMDRRRAGRISTIQSVNRWNQLFFLIPLLTIQILGSYLTGARVTVITLLVYSAFVLPGYILLKTNKLSDLQAIIYGAPLGISITSFTIMVSVAVNGWNMLYLSAIYLTIITGLATYSFAIRPKWMSLTVGRLASPSENIPALIHLIMALFVVFTFLALNQAGKITDYGYAFTGLFGHDFILRAADSVALAKNIPADNYFFLGQKTYNYYVLWYILPATTYNLLGTNANIRHIISLICLINVPLFFSFLFFTISDFLDNNDKVQVKVRFWNRKLFGIFVIVLFCYSYQWLYVLLKSLLPIIGLDRFANLFSHMHSLSHSWFRDIVFEPHCILALMMILLIVKLVSLQPSFSRGFAIGWFLSSILLTDISIFLMISFAYSIYLIGQARSIGRAIIFKDLVGALLCGSVVVLAMFIIGIFVVPEYSNHIIIRPYTIVILGLPLFLILNYAVMPVAAIPAIKQIGSQKKGFMVTIILVSLFFMLFVTETLEGNVILRKSMELLRLPLVLFTCYYIYHSNKEVFFKIIVICLLASFPTFLTDLYVLTDVNNKARTTYITPSEMEAALWLKRNTARHSVVQSLIDYPGCFNYSLTICFGERRAALGHWKMAFQRYPNKHYIRRRIDQIDMMFSSVGNELRYNLARKLKLNYVFLGSKEEERFPGCRKRFGGDSEHFKQVFANYEVGIYKVM